MNKRGQITVLIVVAIVVVAGFLIYFSVRESPSFSVSPEVAPIFNFVQNCVEKSTVDSIYHVGQYGGYYLVPERASGVGMPFYYEEGRSYILSKEQLEVELGKFVENDLFFCTKNFVDFQDYLVTSGEIGVDVEVVDNEVRYLIDYPLSIKKGEDVFTINNFESVVDSRLNSIYEVASLIVEDLVLERGLLCINCISKIAEENEIVVGIDTDLFESDVLVVSLIDEKELIGGEPYRYYFAIKHES